RAVLRDHLLDDDVHLALIRSAASPVLPHVITLDRTQHDPPLEGFHLESLGCIDPSGAGAGGRPAPTRRTCLPGVKGPPPAAEPRRPPRARRGPPRRRAGDNRDWPGRSGRTGRPCRCRGQPRRQRPTPPTTGGRARGPGGGTPGGSRMKAVGDPVVDATLAR